jgi:hypothetical protein
MLIFAVARVYCALEMGSSRTPNPRNQTEVIDKAHSYVAALAHNRQVIDDHPPLARCAQILCTGSSTSSAGPSNVAFDVRL